MGRHQSAPPSHDFRAHRGRRPPELGPQPPRLLRLVNRPPAARIRYRPGTPCRHRFSRGTPKLSSLRRTVPGSQIRRWRLGAGVQYGCHHPPRYEDGHGRQGPQRPSYRPTGWGPTKSPQLGPVPPLTPRTAPLSALSSYIRIYPPTRPAWMPAGKLRHHAASLVLSPTTVATFRNIFQGC